MAEELKKHCGTCKHAYLGPGYEPCKSCSDDCSNWEERDGIIPVPENVKIVEVYEKKLYTVTIILLQVDQCSGFKSMVSTNVLNYYFMNNGVFCAEMDNGELFMCPKENIHYIKVQQTYKKEE